MGRNPARSLAINLRSHATEWVGVVWVCVPLGRTYWRVPTHCKRRLHEHQHRLCGWYDLTPNRTGPGALEVSE